MDDESGYELDDPKHPTFLDRMYEDADLRRKRAKEDAFFCTADDIDESAGAKDDA